MKVDQTYIILNEVGYRGAWYFFHYFKDAMVIRCAGSYKKCLYSVSTQKQQVMWAGI